MKLHEQMAFLRKKKGLTQLQVATELGMSDTNYGNLERGETEIKICHLKNFAKLMQVELIIDLFEKNHIPNSTEINHLKELMVEKNQQIKLLTQLINVLEQRSVSDTDYFDSAIGLHNLYLKNHSEHGITIFEQAKHLYHKAMQLNTCNYETLCHLGHLYLRYIRKGIIMQTINKDEIEKLIQMASHLYELAKEISVHNKIDNTRNISNQINLALTKFFLLKNNDLKSAQSFLMLHRENVLNQIKNYQKTELELNYNLACIEAQLLNPHQAIVFLNHALKHSYPNHHPLSVFQEDILHDEDLIALRETSVFQNWFKRTFIK